MYNAEMIRKEAFDEGYKQGLARGLRDNVQKEKNYAEGFDAGRAAGFAAGYAAAQGQPSEKIEQAYQQGRADAAKLVPVRKNGVGY